MTMPACRILCAGVLAAMLAGLSGCSGSTPLPAMYNDVGVSGVRLDRQEAASIINSYRRSQGLEPLKLDGALSNAAERHSEDMARNDKLSHKVTRGSFAERLKQAGIAAYPAAENIGAGYRTIAQAFSGWRGSPDHNKNMLLDAARRMGIAAVYAPHSKYRVFWTLIVAADERPQ